MCSTGNDSPSERVRYFIYNEKIEAQVISSSSEFSLLGMELLSKAKITFEPAKDVLIIEPSLK